MEDVDGMEDVKAVTNAAADLGLLSPAWAGTPVAAATGDAALVQALLDVETAWVQVQADAGLATREEAEAARRAADSADYDLASLAARTPDGANVLIPLLKDYRARVTAHAPDAPVLAVHRGATSQDIIDTAMMVLAARAGVTILSHLSVATEALATLAERHRDDVCMARSLTQHALPITVGHRLARWLLALDDAAHGLREQLAALPVQWGGAAGTLASLVDTLGSERPARDLVAALATRLGLVAPITAWHTHRAPITQLAAALAQVVAAGGKIAGDVLLLARPEIAELAEPQAPGRGGSSAMPHKRNPVLSVEIKAAALEAPGHVGTLFLAAGQAQEERPDGAWHTEWAALRSLLRLAGGTASKVATLCTGLQVFPERSREVAALFGDVVLSERIAARVGPLLPGGTARVQELVGQSLDQRLPLGELLRAELPTATVSDADLAALLDPANYLGLAPSDVDAVVHRYRSRKDTA